MDINEKIGRLKLKADLFLKEKKKSFVRDIYDNYYFCYIKDNRTNELDIENFEGPRFDDGKIYETLDWLNVIKVDRFVAVQNV